ncbi:hypothetical protein CALCODRAFT_290659 [Calocera cornea HHB12733]|uniref:Zn(2)-C6 fungal-type domain-containing protein n=1 Tax=Calocera cornea HHB12733 TaxID=1353952 RepID=A0A165FSV5_9BASI|nr:hypothetical protein CALCODRAFT_290659 [Calocera cornea HHB12733]
MWNSTPGFVLDKNTRKRKLYPTCDTCKLRRVRCERESQDQACLKCKDKGIQCTTAGPKRRKSRTGKLIEQAKVLYGKDAENAAEISRSNQPGTGLSTPSCDSDTYDTRRFDSMAAHPLTMDSVNSRLSLAEIVSTLSSQLIGEYFQPTHFRQPLYRWNNFLEEFEEAGRRPDQMAGMGGVLAHVLIAYGAYASDSPAILGPGAPKMRKLEAEEIDFIHWGRQRAAVCQSLVDRAVRAADEHGVFHVECNESILILLLLEKLVDHGDTSGRRGRPFRVAAFGHARTLCETDCHIHDQTELQGGGLGWNLYTRDTLQAALAERKPQLEEEDVDKLRGPKLRPLGLPTAELFYEALSGNILVWIPIIRVWDHILEMIRPFAARMAKQPSAKEPSEDPFADSFLRELYHNLDEAEQCIQHMQSRLHHLINVAHPSYMFFQFYWNAVNFGCMLVVFLAHRSVERELQRLNDRADRAHLVTLDELVELGLSEHEKLRARLLQLKQEADKRMQKGARRLAAVLWAMQNSLSSRTGMGIMEGIEMVYETLPTFAKSLCTMPSREEGGSGDFPLDTKIQEIGWLLSTYRSLGWSWADMADSVRYLEDQHSRFVAMRSGLSLALDQQPLAVLSDFLASSNTGCASGPFDSPTAASMSFSTGASTSAGTLSDPFAQIYGSPITGQYPDASVLSQSLSHSTSYDDLQQWLNMFQDQLPPAWDSGRTGLSPPITSGLSTRSPD